MVKYAGAGYLVYLGIRMIISARSDTEFTSAAQAVRRSPLWQGVATEVLNPKTAIFFLAFIPQFVNRANGSFRQFLLLGTISITLNTCADLLVILLASPIGARLRASAALRRRQRAATGLTLVGLGAYLALSDSK